jgi:hypothetical protein
MGCHSGILGKGGNMTFLEYLVIAIISVPVFLVLTTLALVGFVLFGKRRPY